MGEHVSFSVCIPSYHSEERIKAAVESVLRQKYPAVEIIVCDQGDTDTSFLRKIDSRIKRIWLEEPSTYNARCELIKAVNNDYFIQLDDDDSLTEDALWSLDLLIRETGFGDIYSFQKVRTPIEEDMSRFDSSVRLLDKESFLHYCISIDRGFHNDMVTKCCKRLGDRFSYEPKKMCNNEDGYLLLELCDYAKTFFLFNKVLYHIHPREGSASRIHSFERLTNEARYLVYLVRRVGLCEALVPINSTNNAIYNNVYFAYLQGTLSRHNWDAFIKNRFVRALRRMYLKHAFFLSRHVEDRRYFLLFVLRSYALYRLVVRRTLSHKPPKERFGQ